MRFSSRSFVVVSALAGLSAAASLGMAACSSDDPAAPPPDDAGTDRRQTDSGPFQPLDPDVKQPQTKSQCIAACRTKHAAGFEKDKAIDQCWAASCVPACADGPLPEAGADAGDDAGDDAGLDAGAPGDAGAPACKNDVATGDIDCDRCTKERCCGAWDGCFDDADCRALNACIVECEKL